MGRGMKSEYAVLQGNMTAGRRVDPYNGGGQVTGLEPMLMDRDWNDVTEDDWAKVLSEMSLFSEVSRRQLRKLAKQAQFAELARGETVMVKGDEADSFYVILSGTAEVRSPTARLLTTGDYFGELALLDDRPRSATVVATDDLHIMRLPRKAFMELVDEQPGIAHAMLTELGARFRRLERERRAG
jgi:CRP/FNR family transcriptional regulator, cyclic AMP receptor protein